MSSRTERVRRLGTSDHDRGVTGMTYVYPVVSRRARGVSIGINLNPNNACNWRCVYCQVPDLVAGKAPPVDLALLARELEEMLEDVVHGDFLARAAPPEARRLNDVAFSGNGEPTTSRDFRAALEQVAVALEHFGLIGKIRIVLITNGSMLHKPDILPAIGRLAELGGEVWFKLDSATDEGNRRINGHRVPVAEHLQKLATAAAVCPTWIQSCWFSWNGEAPSDHETTCFVECLERLHEDGVPLRGVQLYTLARPSLQPEASELAPLPEAWLARFADRIRELGLDVSVSA